MATKYSLQDIALLKNRSIFVDANVLIYLFWPSGSFSWEKNYATAFRHLLRQENNLFVDFMVVSEIVNRILRIEHLKFNQNLKYKDYRDSSEGYETLQDIFTIVKNNILTRFELVGKVFNRSDVENFLIADELDFVDKGIVCLCRENSFVLLTNDKDFKNSGLDILTGNPSILK